MWGAAYLITLNVKVTPKALGVYCKGETTYKHREGKRTAAFPGLDDFNCSDEEQKGGCIQVGDFFFTPESSEWEQWMKTVRVGMIEKFFTIIEESIL